MFRKSLRISVITLLIAPVCFAGTLRVGVPQVEGNQVVLPVVLEGDTGGGVAALDFTLNYDPAVFTPVSAEASDVAQAARKQVESNEVSPGNYVVMLFGMNQTTVSNGEIASITLTKKAHPDSNQSNVTIEQTTFASVEGQEIDSQGSSQTVIFPPPPANDDEGETPPPSDETPPPAEPDNEEPIPTPTPPVSTPDAPTTPVPGVPVGSPSEPNRPETESPRVTPMVVASASREPGRLDGASVDGVARMNRAAQQLENSRAALSGSARIANRAALRDGAEEFDDSDEAASETPATTNAPEASAVERPMIAAAPAGAPSAVGPGEVPALPVTQEAADASGIPPSSRRLLMIVGSVIVVSLVVYRFARRSAQ
ncbi:MAG: hypothetical protein HUU46_19990 [Candidatus Hydrogenedentes bacterium]|nr:hypothetical protein [Candidatus Hydrogenedentota bacterium]